MAKKLIILLFLMISCKSTQDTQELKVVTTIEEEAKTANKPNIELSVGPNVEVQDVELSDFRNFEVWVTTKYMDTIGNGKLERVARIKGIDTLPHFFVKFKKLPIVYKMKIENKELVFAKMN